MVSERWQNVKQILETALSKNPRERETYLGTACGADADLRREVDEYLAFENSEVDGLEDSPIAKLGSSKETLKHGDEVGRYRVIEDLGVGGMGSVYLAERTDGDFTQQVAEYASSQRAGID